MALARMYLEHQGAMRNQIVVPLDAHIDLFRTAQTDAEAVGDEVTLHRTDLALFDLDLAKRTVSCNLVELKCYAQHLGLSGYGQLKERITEQLNQSERVLQRHFDPQRTTPDRPDRRLKTRELASLLDFYLERGRRYRLMDSEAAEEAGLLLDRLEEGYALQFTRSGLVFDFDKPGTDPPEHEVGIEFHRIGVDLIHELVNNTGPIEPEPSSTEGSEDDGDGGEVGEAAQVAELATAIPRLATAAFLAAERDRSTTDLDSPSEADEDIDVAQPKNASTPGPADDTSLSAEDDAAVSEPPESARAGEIPSSAEDPSDSAVGPVDTDLVARPTDHSQPTPVAEYLPPVQESERPQDAAGPEHDVILGVTTESPQYGLLGESSGRKIALDLNQTHTISLFGIQGGGKSYTLGSVVEMACMPAEGVNDLPHPLGAVIFHYSSTLDYRPEFTSMAAPNNDGAEVHALIRTLRRLPPGAHGSRHSRPGREGRRTTRGVSRNRSHAHRVRGVRAQGIALEVPDGSRR